MYVQYVVIVRAGAGDGDGDGLDWTGLDWTGLEGREGKGREGILGVRGWGQGWVEDMCGLEYAGGWPGWG